VPENRDGPPPVSLSSPPRESTTPRLNYTKLKKHHQRYKRSRIERPTFEPRATDPRHYERYKEEDENNGYSRDNKEVTALKRCSKKGLAKSVDCVMLYKISGGCCSERCLFLCFVLSIMRHYDMTRIGIEKDTGENILTHLRNAL